MAPLTQSAFMDLNGNMPATNNPWVTVGGDGNPEITFNVYIRDHLSRINTAAGTSLPEDPTMVLYIMNQAKIVGEMKASEATQENIMACIVGVKDEAANADEVNADAIDADSVESEA